MGQSFSAASKDGRNRYFGSAICFGMKKGQIMSIEADIAEFRLGGPVARPSFFAALLLISISGKHGV